jgi:hypothetical protein
VSKLFENELESALLFDNVLKGKVDKWRTNPRRDESHLTKALAEAIEKEKAETGFHADSEVSLYNDNSVYGCIDILFTPENKHSETASTPLAIIEVGRNGSEWWKKLDQSMKYLANMGSHQRAERLGFKEPLLVVVLTIEGEDEGADAKVRQGVFLCAPKSTQIDDYRMCLLWHSRTNNLVEASNHFGRVIRATSDFSLWREDNKSNDAWTYLGPNCCKVKVDQVCGSTVVFCVPMHALPTFSCGFPLPRRLQDGKQISK